MRLLLVEDDPRLANALAKNLKDESYALDQASDGVEGEELAKINEYDVIILDVMMPNQDGWTTVRHLRAANVRTPILMLTALSDVSDRVLGLDSGADDYLAKPFHFKELAARLRSLIRRRSESRTSILEHYGLALNLNTHKASRDGRDITLTSKEFALLELFMLNPGRVLTRAHISEHLWDMNFDPRSNVIESFVRYLRQKIDKGFDQPLIQTVRGAGYMFTDGST